MQDKVALLLPRQREQVRIGLRHSVQQAALDPIAAALFPLVLLGAALQLRILYQKVRDGLLRKRPSNLERVVFHKGLVARRMLLDHRLRVEAGLVVDTAKQPQAPVDVRIFPRDQVQQIIIRRVAVKEDGADHPVGQHALFRNALHVAADAGCLYRAGLARGKADKVLPERLPHGLVQHAAVAHRRLRQAAVRQELGAGALQLSPAALLFLCFRRTVVLRSFYLRSSGVFRLVFDAEVVF